MAKQVLIVDDDPAVLQTLRRILERQGLPVSTAGSGNEALDALRRGFKGLILMDVIMDGMDGWETIQAMVNEGLQEGNLILMLTGESQPDTRLDHLKEHVLDYLVKPIHAQELVAVVKGYCDDFQC